jgi:hypothetical protein
MKLVESFNEFFFRASKPVLEDENLKTDGPETDDQKLERLRKMGLAPKMDFYEALSKAQDEWEEDQEIQDAISTLSTRTSEILEKCIKDDEYADEYNEYCEQLANDTSLYDLGYLEYMMASGAV